MLKKTLAGASKTIAGRHNIKFAVVLTPGEDGSSLQSVRRCRICNARQGGRRGSAQRQEAIAGWLEAEADKVRKEAEAPVVLVDVYWHASRLFPAGKPCALSAGLVGSTVVRKAIT
jgi:hypothetical protein